MASEACTERCRRDRGGQVAILASIVALVGIGAVVSVFGRGQHDTTVLTIIGGAVVALIGWLTKRTYDVSQATDTKVDGLVNGGLDAKLDAALARSFESNAFRVAVGRVLDERLGAADGRPGTSTTAATPAPPAPAGTRQLQERATGAD